MPWTKDPPEVVFRAEVIIDPYSMLWKILLFIKILSWGM
jgi:hypothetical protein